MGKIRLAGAESPGNEKGNWWGIHSFLCKATEIILSLYLLLMLVALPFHYTQGYARIGTDKAEFFRNMSYNTGRVLTVVLVLRLLLRFVIWCRKQRNTLLTAGKKWSVTDWCMAVYGATVLISYWCSAYKEQALWGAAEWYMGCFTQMTFVSVYFLLSRAWKPKRWVFVCIMAVSAVVFALGYVNRFGWYPIPMISASESFISTIGNINWYCGYLTTVFFLGVFLLWYGRELAVWKKAVLLGYCTLGFASLLTQGSSSGLLALGSILFVMFVLSCREDAGVMQGFWQIVMVLAVSCIGTMAVRKVFAEKIVYEWTDPVFLKISQGSLSVLLLLAAAGLLLLTKVLRKKGKYPAGFCKGLGHAAVILAAGALLVFVALLVWNTKMPGKLGSLSEMSVFQFNPSWGSSRGATWTAGMGCFLEQNWWKKLIGVGPDCMSAYLYTDASEALVQYVNAKFGGTTLTNAHNEWLTILVNMGLFGAFSYIGAMMSGAVRMVRSRKQNLAAAACGFCVLAYTFNNIFSFQQTLNGITVFILLGVGESCLRNAPEIRSSKKHPKT